MSTFILSAPVALLLVELMADRAEPLARNDAWFYIRMANHPGQWVGYTFSFRVLVPYFVHLLPWSAPLGFEFVTAISLAAVAGLLVAFLDDLSLTPWLGLCLVAAAPGILVLLRDPYLVDAPGLVDTLIILLLVRRQNWDLIALALAIGVVIQERQAALLLPVLAVAMTVRPRPRVIQIVTIVLAPMAIYLMLHKSTALFGAVPPSYPYLSWANVQNIIAFRAHRDGGIPRAIVLAFAGSLGPAWPMAALGWRHATRFLRVTAVYVLPCMAACALASDWDRMLTSALPVVVPLACASVKRTGIGSEERTAHGVVTG
jgi:hypothetical protein